MEWRHVQRALGVRCTAPPLASIAGLLSTLTSLCSGDLAASLAALLRRSLSNLANVSELVVFGQNDTRA